MTYPAGRTLSELEHNLAAIQQRIDTACRRASRDPSEVRLLPVSKTVDEARLRLAYRAGCREFGENKVQEAQRKEKLCKIRYIKMAFPNLHPRCKLWGYGPQSRTDNIHERFGRPEVTCQGIR